MGYALRHTHVAGWQKENPCMKESRLVIEEPPYSIVVLDHVHVPGRDCFSLLTKRHTLYALYVREKSEKSIRWRKKQRWKKEKNRPKRKNN